MDIGINCLYCCQFARVILVPTGMVWVELASARAWYAAASNLICACTSFGVVKAASRAQITPSTKVFLIASPMFTQQNFNIPIS